ncbi:MAG: hypothetical protein H7Y36_00730 [Armatimonadetes bacterium]|nr:hypothetical protein [Akkermansiaceae bacterium]
MNFRIIATALAFYCSPAGAQDQRTVDCHFLCFQRDGENTAKLSVRQKDDQVVTCPLPLELVSKGFPLIPNRGVIDFIKGLDDKVPAARARIPADVKKALIVFIAAPLEKAPLRYDTFVLDFSSKGFPKDGSMVVNLYAGDIRVSIGEHRAQIKPGKTAGFERPEKRNDFNMSGVRIEFQELAMWNEVTDTTGRFPSGQQQLFFAFWDPRNQSPSCRSFLISSDM